jgi:hypothetical protein
MAKFKEWFYKKISEDNTPAMGPTGSFDAQLAGLLAAKDPSSQVNRTGASVTDTANKFVKASPKPLVSAVGTAIVNTPEGRKAALAALGGSNNNQTNRNTNTMLNPQIMNQPTTVPGGTLS